jgi:hypothetical protein
MLWLGLRGRVKIASLEKRMEELEKAFRDLDLEMAANVDRLTGIAKRIQGRRGGRPPEGKPEGEAEPELEVPNGFSRHVL